MLKPLAKSKIGKSKGRFAIVASEYNAKFVNSMLESAKAELAAAGVVNVTVVRVPGAYEIPVVANRLAKVEPPISAIICLGVIIEGETAHADHIGRAVSQALMEIQLMQGVPVIHEVLQLKSEKQAKKRCMGKKFNRGTEAAQTALKMAKVMSEI